MKPSWFDALSDEDRAMYEATIVSLLADGFRLISTDAIRVLQTAMPDDALTQQALAIVLKERDE